MADTDNDGCRDGKEIPLAISPTDPWDFYSVPVPALINASDPTSVVRDNIVSSGDAQSVYAYFKVGAHTGTAAYEQDLNGNGIKDGVEYDRTVLGAGQTGPPDGAIGAQEAQAAFAQFKAAFFC